jgi:hypothetical protein
MSNGYVLLVALSQTAQLTMYLDVSPTRVCVVMPFCTLRSPLSQRFLYRIIGHPLELRWSGLRHESEVLQCVSILYRHLEHLVLHCRRAYKF